MSLAANALQMDAREKYLNQLRLAEQQFRLACTVHLAVTNGIQTLDVGRGLTAGLGIVALAIVLDRVTQSFGRTTRASDV